MMTLVTVEVGNYNEYMKTTETSQRLTPPWSCRIRSGTLGLLVSLVLNGQLARGRRFHCKHSGHMSPRTTRSL